jgi:type IV secretory pathway VirB2 component (pilin)
VSVPVPAGLVAVIFTMPRECEPAKPAKCVELLIAKLVKFVPSTAADEHPRDSPTCSVTAVDRLSQFNDVFAGPTAGTIATILGVVIYVKIPVPPVLVCVSGLVTITSLIPVDIDGTVHRSLIDESKVTAAETPPIVSVQPLINPSPARFVIEFPLVPKPTPTLDVIDEIVGTGLYV